MKKLNFLFIAFCFVTSSYAQNLTATDIVRKADENRRGESLYSEIKMTIVRPTWQREISIKTWAKGEKYSLSLITAPAKDKGQAFLKRQKDLWNWQPSISRMIKMSSSIMGQSWMGSDFTNDDLMRESSNVSDFTHQLEKSEKIREFDCYKIILTPKEEASVVWGKIIMWISKEDYIEIKTEFYDEENVLINTFNGYDVKSFGKRKLCAQMEIVPADKPKQKTVMTIIKYDFETQISEGFFSQQNMKSIK